MRAVPTPFQPTTPLQPTTPFAGKMQPGEVRAPLREEKGVVGAKVASGMVEQEEATKENLAAEDKKKEVVKEDEHEQGSGVVPDLVPQSEQQDGETDSLYDLNIVAFSEAQRSDAEARTDTLDMRAGSPEDALASPQDTKMESPDTLDGKLDTPPESPDSVSLPEAPSSEPDSPQTQVRT